MVSVVIPVWNDAASLRILLQHLSAEPDPVEFIVVDGGSTDDVEDVASRFARVRFLTSCLGRGFQMNAGARAAVGDTLVFLHSDTLPPAGGISELPNLLRSRRADFGAFRVRFDPACFLPQSLAVFTRLTKHWTCFGDQAIFVNRSFFEATGGFPEIPILEEVHWLRRAAKIGKMTRSSQAVVTSARRFQHAGQVRQTLRNGWILLLDRMGTDPARLAETYLNGHWIAIRTAADGVPPQVTGLPQEQPSEDRQ